MIWTEEAINLSKEINDFVINRYKILKIEFNKKSDDYIIENILIPNCSIPFGIREVYIFYSLKIYDVIDKHINVNFYFDQVYGNFPYKGPTQETNMFNSDNEIFNIADEFGLKSEEKNILRQIFSRIRYLASKNIYNYNIAYNFNICVMDYENPKYYENENFKIYFKNYLNKNPKYLRYLDLLRKVLVKSYYFRKNIYIPFTHQQLIKVLDDSFVWVILEPYNSIL